MNPFTRRRRTETGGEPVYKPLPRLPAPELGEAWRERAAEVPAPAPAECGPCIRHRNCGDGHELVGWYGTPHCWMCGGPGRTGMAERVGDEQ
jgi:hypothetical protein